MAKAPAFTSNEDRHLIFNAPHQDLKCYKADGTLEWHVQARGRSIKHLDSSQTDGNTPPGLYLLDGVQHLHDKAYGPYRIHLKPIELDKGKGRDGIFIHGGGSDLNRPFAPHQGWEGTYGCIRVQNHDLGWLVNKVRGVHGKKSQLWLTVRWW